MPWRTSGPMEERTKFILMYYEDGWMMTDLCEMFGVSRKTGYKWCKRYEEEGMAGLRAFDLPPKKWTG